LKGETMKTKPMIELLGAGDLALVRLTGWVDRLTFDRYRSAAKDARSLWIRVFKVHVIGVEQAPALLTALAGHRIPFRVRFDLRRAIRETKKGEM